MFSSVSSIISQQKIGGSSAFTSACHWPGLPSSTPSWPAKCWERRTVRRFLSMTTWNMLVYSMTAHDLWIQCSETLKPQSADLCNTCKMALHNIEAIKTYYILSPKEIKVFVWTTRYLGYCLNIISYYYYQNYCLICCYRNKWTPLADQNQLFNTAEVKCFLQD